MLCFVPPLAGPPRPDLPDRPERTWIGIALALALTLLALGLPWLRPGDRHAAEPAAPAHPAPH